MKRDIVEVDWLLMPEDARAVEKRLRRRPGIQWVDVSPVSGLGVVEYDFSVGATFFFTAETFHEAATVLMVFILGGHWLDLRARSTPPTPSVPSWSSPRRWPRSSPRGGPSPTWRGTAGWRV